MNYTNYNMGSYNLHIIKNSSFKTITIRVNFKSKLNKSEITARNLLRLNLINSTKKYPTERLMNIESENLYNLGYSCQGMISGNFLVMSFFINFLDSKYIEEDNLEQSIDFLCEMLFNPNVEGKKFESTNFNLVKDSLKNTIESEFENPSKYASNRLLEEMDKNANYAFNPNGYLDDLEKIDEKTLYKTYETMLAKDIIDIFVIGDVSPTNIRELFSKKIPINTMKKPVATHFIEHKKLRSKTKIVKEQKDISQSKLYLGFKVDNNDLFEKQYVASIYTFILGGGPDSKLFQSVREKNSLCYYVSASFKPISNLLIITSGIDKKDYKKAVSLIKKEIKNMVNGDFNEEDIKKAVSTYLNSCESVLDSPAAIVNNYVTSEYLGFDLIDERIANIKKVTKDMIVNFAKKVHLDTIFLLQGGDANEEEEI